MHERSQRYDAALRRAREVWDDPEPARRDAAYHLAVGDRVVVLDDPHALEGNEATIETVTNAGQLGMLFRVRFDDGSRGQAYGWEVEMIAPWETVGDTAEQALDEHLHQERMRDNS